MPRSSEELEADVYDIFLRTIREMKNDARRDPEFRTAASIFEGNFRREMDKRLSSDHGR